MKICANTNKNNKIKYLFRLSILLKINDLQNLIFENFQNSFL